MKKFLTLFSLTAICCLLLPACSDDVLNEEIAPTRSYEKDAEVLSHLSISTNHKVPTSSMRQRRFILRTT